MRACAIIMYNVQLALQTLVRRSRGMIFAETELVITEDVVGSDELAYFVMDNILPSDCKTHKPPPPTHTLIPLTPHVA